MHWSQNYDPLGNAFLSTLVAALPVIVLLGSLAFLKVRIHFAALLGLAVALAVALLACKMPPSAVAATTLFGLAYGLFPIGWIILNLMFLYQLTVEKGSFAVLRGSLGAVAPDSRVQVVLVAFCFGAFFEGAAGFGTPVAVSAAILMQLGFKPLAASGLSLIANTAPVAFGALGTPIIALKSVTDLDLHHLSAMVGRQLSVFSLIVPGWVVWAYAGWRGLVEIWPVALTAGVAYAVPQFLVSNYHGPWLVDIVGSICSMMAVLALLRFWQPKTVAKVETATSAPGRADSRTAIRQAWIPWMLLTAFVFLWGLPPWKAWLNGQSPLHVSISGSSFMTLLPQLNGAYTAVSVPVPSLHEVVLRAPPVAPPNAPAEKAIFSFNWLSATGTGILVAALVSGLFMKFGLGELVRIYVQTVWRVRYSLITIAAMLAVGYVTKYSGTDATLGLALAKTGILYPFFGTLLGWLGVALTGSDTASNVLFGSLQKITAEQTGVNPTLMAAANSSGGVMGKMIDAQSIVVASTATNWYGHEGTLLRFVFFHSLALAVLVGLLVFLQAKVFPFTEMVVR
ncbi:MAG: L-lactate permease [Verrucomicrobiota bacterium]